MAESQPVIAWAESPLQLIGAAEWASAHDRTVSLAARLTDQMPETADELIARGARFGECAPYLGIPWRLLARHGHWLVGDGFSGQFRLAATVLRPRRITFLDDGANTLAFADALLGRRAYARPGVAERGLATRVAPLVEDHVLRRALAGDVELFTAFDLGGERAAALGERGVRIERHRFPWTRATARPRPDLGRRIVLGSARPVDGRLPMSAYIAWVAGQASAEPVVYLPHRREPRDQLELVAALPGVRVVRTGMPAELVLAGLPGSVEIRTLPSSTTTTLSHVLHGSAAVVRSRASRARNA
ncbi:hypothetical protein N8K70_01200 [Microbacterium betulae]|uniref:Uncharacterized protein n=1 Tax=Microbacterium betulae TaxID=2981139 RepID=A0AA97FKW3_9MICO|nr:hypothetical protein [Microbacterium sp. AB]WOF23317.1 hypothetical protein N8K70_01200 [Microbacterium sp. AB]